MKNTKRDQSAVARHIRAFTGLCMLAMPASQAVTGCTAQGPATLSEGNVGQTEQALTTCVTIRRGNGTVADARLSKDAKNQNFGNNPVLQVGEDDHTLVRFDLSDIPSSAVINSATLKVYAHGGGNGGQCGEDEDDDDGKIRIHRAKNAWAENTVTYKNFNNQYDNAVSGTLVGHNHTALQSANVKTLVAQWVSGAKPNYGFLLENKDGDDKTNFTSSEGNNASLRPALEVCYTTPDDNHCSPNPCVHGACTNAPDGYSCACDAGWSGTNCDTNINDCAASPCQNGGTCTDDVGGYSCSCPAGYTGTNCEYDIDECASSPCVNGDCTDLVNGYTCSCNPGFSGTNCETNIDDCAGAPCQNGGTCTDDVGGYSCSCPAGYTGTNCEYEIDECASSPCVNGMCIDQVNSYECVCNPGFGGADCSTNIDECAGNPCQNGGTCTDGIFSYTCSCPAGYTGDNCEIDIDECASQPCVNGDCVDQVNAYECGCQPGWTGGLCEIEIDECESMPCVNGQCVDHVNGYECGCAPGWTGGLCEIEIDECESMPCVNGQCVDQVNGYECGCAPGWTGGLCEIEIDECESMPCVNGQCVDQVNGYECQCDPGWSGTNCETQAAATCPCTGSNYWLGGTVTGCSAWSSDSFTLDGSVEATVDLFTSDGNGGNQFSTGYFSASGPGGGAPYDATCYGYINNGSQSSVYISGLSVAQVQACAAELQAAAVANGYSCF